MMCAEEPHFLRKDFLLTQSYLPAHSHPPPHMRALVSGSLILLESRVQCQSYLPNETRRVTKCSLSMPEHDIIINDPRSTFKIEALYTQSDFDIVSECKSLLADAECLKVVTDVLQTLGFGNVVTNNPCETLKNTLTKVANISPERAGDLVSFLKLNDFDELTRKLGGIKSVIADKIKEGMDQLQKLFEYCDILGIRRKVQFDCSVACALGIYNGVVFKTTLEARNQKVQNLESNTVNDDVISFIDSVSSGPENVNPAKRLASGGRYDGLFSRLAGKKVEIYAVGFAFYFEEIFSNYKSNQDIRSKKTEFLITSDNEESCIKEKLKLCKESWNAKIKVEMSHSSDSANLQANTEGIRFIAHIGQSEIPKGLVHLEDTWTKEKISIETSKVTDYIKERLNGKEH
ncbi:Histidine--tRNA ligase, cytoplasmic [Holothuria leucospilota]|uniref:Histidine--tRNA ligase, cytoplasmic n=1 Tax=Holothuria leucospilota TaxID=206669 RepID=A0A9Q1CU55_HOLLE|nr:Histidine--tRNA ligase, cytoplasmic [Holothuria leucospilota]